ncbi:hypothetical protein BpHYR1_029669 [Brachionus plicatilis]|uniref:Uncharacterized protein n=1 Tax=Brachionus plicatilis TaxID=10195 RepID=A0A3M7QXW8_BRAPC|nr:hypothetical protein BpHYR1_029669 [Brachionus plicatilis]
MPLVSHEASFWYTSFQRTSFMSDLCPRRLKFARHGLKLVLWSVLVCVHPTMKLPLPVANQPSF